MKRANAKQVNYTEITAFILMLSKNIYKIFKIIIWGQIMSNANWKNKTIYTSDNLYVMRGMNSESVDLIYLDPPFNSNKVYAAPIGSKAAGAAFKDTWTLSDVDIVEAGRLREQCGEGIYKFMETVQFTHSKGMRSYLTMMASRLLEMKRILKLSGTIYLHCDPTASHYLKLLMDAIFDKDSYRNEIVWAYRRWPAKHPNFQRMHDIILRYTRCANDNVTWNQLYEPLAESTLKSFGSKQQIADFKSGKRKPSQTSEDSPGAPMRDIWDIGVIAPIAKERTGFPTQKPLKLLKRIILASSNENDIVFDPFCGCATTMVAADLLNRQWAGVDISPRAVELLVDRIKGHQGLFRDITDTKIKPKRTDLEPELTPLEKKAHKGALFALQNQICNGCGTWFGRMQDFEMDHITPLAHGGTDHRHNFQLLCGNCNRKKGKKSQEQFMALTQKIRAEKIVA